MNLFSDTALDAVTVQCHFKEELCVASDDLFSIPSLLSPHSASGEGELNLAAEVLSKVVALKTA